MAYYAEKLSGKRLRRCYEIAPPRVKQYLQAEIDHVLDRLRPEDSVLELGCGYGRVAWELAKKASRVVGIDTAAASLNLGRQLGSPGVRCEFIEMDASALGFPDQHFDFVLCIQNGICAFGVDKVLLIQEAARVCRLGGRILFSSYAERFWPHRLEWFELQAAHGLLGDIDHESTGSGEIVCKDGFRAGFMRPADFQALWASLDLTPKIREVDGSTTFCESVTA
jgi:2-polyprenyl-6-hydroxyphenyl methylase/3-demethylubiquinone-9 3-methyltransferase